MVTRKTLLTGALAGACLLALSPLGPAPLTARAAAPSATHVVGTLQAGFSSTAPTTLQLVTGQGTAVAVNVTSATRIVRRYNGPSGLDELTPGDRIDVTGTMSGTATINATRVKDYTIQRAYTRNVGRIIAISSDMTTLTLRVLRDPHVESQSPFEEGQTIFVAVTPAMSVTLSDGSLGTVQDDLGPGLVITTLGVFNRNTRTFQDVSRIHVWSPTPGQTTELRGILQAGSGTAVPTTLTVQTPHRGLVTVAVSSATKLVRRYNGPSALAELSAGDTLSIVATYLGGSSYSATLIKDVSIQAAYTGMAGQIKTISGSTVTAQVVKDSRFKVLNPFWVGESVTFSVTAQTPVVLANGTAGTISNLQPGMRVYTLGVFNRKAHAFVSVARVRILG